MKIRLYFFCVIVGAAVLSVAQDSKPNAAAVARGKYLVTEAGLCQDCHSPRNQKGEYIKEKWLQGSPLPFQPLIEMPWTGTAPPIAGLEGWTDEQAIKFFMTGIRKDGSRPKPPMPQYRFSKADATAITAYLRSLKMAPSAPKHMTVTPSR